MHPLIRRLVQVHAHHDPGFNRDAKEGDISHPHGDAEVVPKQPLQNQPAGHGIEGREDEDHCLRYGVEDHVEKQKDHKEHHGQNNLQALFCTLLELVFTRPLIGVASWQLQLLPKQVASLIYESTIVGRVEIDIDIARELPILIADHRRPPRKRNLSHFSNRYLCTGGCCDQHAAQVFDILPEIALIADVNWITLASFDVLGDIHPSYAGFDRLLHIGDG